jgi:hypothetical protein
MRYLAMLSLLLFVGGAAFATPDAVTPLTAPINITVSSFGELHWGSPELTQVKLHSTTPSFDFTFDGTKSDSKDQIEAFWANANYAFDLTESIDNYNPSASVRLDTSLLSVPWTVGGPTTKSANPPGVVHNDYAMVKANYDMTKGVGAESLSATLSVSLSATSP